MNVDCAELELDPTSQQELSLALLKAIRRSGLTLAEISARLETCCGVVLSASGMSRTVNRDTIRFERALQLLAICGVEQERIGRQTSVK